MSAETIVGPFYVRLPDDRGPHCTACSGSMTALAYLGSPEPVLFCDGCGRRAVFCECPMPADHPWAKKAQ